MSSDVNGAIQVLQGGINLQKQNRFKQADSLVISPPFGLLPQYYLSFPKVGVRTSMDIDKSAEVPGSG